MKLKYKKLILIISMSTMGIGLVAFSLGSKSANSDDDKIASTSVVQRGEVDTNRKEEAADVATVTPTPTVEVQITSDETEDEVKSSTADEEVEVVSDKNPLERDAYPEVNKVVQKYLKAKLASDQDTLEKIVTDPSFINIERLQKTTEYIESYNNLEYYTKKAGEGIKEFDFIVYVYQELKITSIDTLAPSMDMLYVKKVGDDYKIVLGDISDTTAEYIYETLESEDVQSLISSVNLKAEEAYNQDEDLRAFNKKLQDGASTKNADDEEEIITSTGNSDE